jgi:hypothetical protein
VSADYEAKKTDDDVDLPQYDEIDKTVDVVEVCVDPPPYEE